MKNYSLKIKKGVIKCTAKIATTLHPKCKVICVSLDSKYGDVGSWDLENDIPVIWFIDNEETINQSKLTNATEISFLEMKGWDIFNAYISKSMLYVTFFKIKKNE